MVAGLLLSACVSIPSPVQRQDAADALARSHRWHAERLSGGAFDLMAYVPDAPTDSAQLTVYIEGDGFAWVSTALASADPTPRDPLALRMALAQPEGNAAYLARACQYVDAQASGCPARYWTGARFSAEVVAASNAAIDTLKRRFRAERLVLVGYSGGAAVAALVAVQRHDVALLVSVAGNLDTLAWTRYLHLQPLTESLNPIDAATALRRIPQVYFGGENDAVIPPELVRAYARRLSGSASPNLHIEPGFDHHCCWAEQWPTLWRSMQLPLREVSGSAKF